MLVILAAHLCAAIVAPIGVARLGRRTLALLAPVPASAAVWAGVMTPRVLGGTPPTSGFRWVPGLDSESSLGYSV